MPSCSPILYTACFRTLILSLSRSFLHSRLSVLSVSHRERKSPTPREEIPSPFVFGQSEPITLVELRMRHFSGNIRYKPNWGRCQRRRHSCQMEPGYSGSGPSARRQAVGWRGVLRGW
ncbi:hypothetical protein C8Q74DRAFT_1310045 [Fomes fomentarius]|nr:hypothetical protein C8Q74DRAFT_1310045 [Fomes fomentarius]